MATPVTIRNIGRAAEKVGATTLAVGAEATFDLDLAATRLALRSDNDLVIVPSAGGDDSGALVIAVSATDFGSGVVSVDPDAPGVAPELDGVTLVPGMVVALNSGGARTGLFVYVADETPMDRHPDFLTVGDYQRPVILSVGYNPAVYYSALALNEFENFDGADPDALLDPDFSNFPYFDEPIDSTVYTTAVGALYQYAMNIKPRIRFDAPDGDGTDMNIQMHVQLVGTDGVTPAASILTPDTEHVWEWWIVEGDSMISATVDAMEQLAGDPTGPVETQDALARRVSFGPVLWMNFTRADAGSIRIAASYGGTLTISEPIVFT